MSIVVKYCRTQFGVADVDSWRSDYPVLPTNRAVDSIKLTHRYVYSYTTTHHKKIDSPVKKLLRAIVLYSPVQTRQG